MYIHNFLSPDNNIFINSITDTQAAAKVEKFICIHQKCLVHRKFCQYVFKNNQKKLPSSFLILHVIPFIQLDNWTKGLILNLCLLVTIYITTFLFIILFFPRKNKIFMEFQIELSDRTHNNFQTGARLLIFIILIFIIVILWILFPQNGLLNTLVSIFNYFIGFFLTFEYHPQTKEILLFKNTKSHVRWVFKLIHLVLTAIVGILIIFIIPRGIGHTAGSHYFSFLIIKKYGGMLIVCIASIYGYYLYLHIEENSSFTKFLFGWFIYIIPLPFLVLIGFQIILMGFNIYLYNGTMGLKSWQIFFLYDTFKLAYSIYLFFWMWYGFHYTVYKKIIPPYILDMINLLMISSTRFKIMSCFFFTGLLTWILSVSLNYSIIIKLPFHIPIILFTGHPIMVKNPLFFFFGFLGIFHFWIIIYELYLTYRKIKLMQKAVPDKIKRLEYFFPKALNLSNNEWFNLSEEELIDRITKDHPHSS